MSATVVSIGVCAVTAGIGCVVAGGAAMAIGAVAAVSQSYAKHGSLKRAIVQGVASAALDKFSGAAFTRVGAAIGVGRIGETAVNQIGVPFAFLGGKGLEAGVDALCGDGVC